MDNESCDSCHFWERKETDKPVSSKGEGAGACRCKPPVATAVVMPHINQIAQTVTHQLMETTVWPVTFANGWCGCYKVGALADGSKQTKQNG